MKFVQGIQEFAHIKILLEFQGLRQAITLTNVQWMLAYHNAVQG